MVKADDTTFEEILYKTITDAVKEDAKQIKSYLDTHNEKPSDRLKSLFNRKRLKAKLKKGGVFNASRKIAVICLISLAAVVTSAMYIGALTRHFSDLTVVFADRYADVRFDTENPIKGEVKFPTLPEGWTTEESPACYYFRGPNGEQIRYCIIPINASYRTDNTSLTIQEISLSDGSPAYLFKSDGTSKLMWKKTYIYELNFKNVSLETVIAIADSIE